jgi:exodeoxyribonuclease VII small subunit
MTDPPANPGLEGRLRRLEEILAKLEAEELDLEHALTLFEEGIGHVREAEKTLAAATLRVEEVLADGATRPLDEDGSGGDPT